MWLDAPWARRVFRAMPAGVTHLVPLDATNSAPITPQYIAALGADQHTASAQLVYRIMTQPAMTAGIKAGLYFWWDDLALSRHSAATGRFDLVVGGGPEPPGRSR